MTLLLNGQWMSTREALAENLRMSERALKEAVLDAVCKEHARELYDAVTALTPHILTMWSEHARGGVPKDFEPWNRLVTVLADIDAEAA
jgi:hypothetical protein